MVEEDAYFGLGAALTRIAASSLCKHDMFSSVVLELQVPCIYAKPKQSQQDCKSETKHIVLGLNYYSRPDLALRSEFR
jgi:hypothetical protein